MINKNFYPTPSDLGQLMLEPYKDLLSKSETIVLEPSAGKGDLCKAVQKVSYKFPSRKIHTVEIEPELRVLLKDKSYPVKGDDFLQFQPQVNYNLIVMNPPFDRAAEHLCHAWKISQGGEIVCLINHRTYANPCDKYRQYVQYLVKQYGSYSYIGQAFLRSERYTGVEVGIVRLTKPKTSFQNFGVFSDNIDTSKEYIHGELEDNHGLASNDLIQAALDAYEGSKELYKQWLEATHKLLNATGIFSSKESMLELMKNSAMSMYYTDVESSSKKEQEQIVPERAYNYYISVMQRRGWNWVLDKGANQFKDIMTSEVRKQFEEELNGQKGLPFTKRNIYQVMDNLQASAGTILKACLVQAHEKLRDFSKENSRHWEGWATNDAFQVNARVIIPNGVHYDYPNREYGSFSLWSKYVDFEDIDKALCLVTKKKYSEIKGIEKRVWNQELGHGQTVVERKDTTLYGTISKFCRDLGCNPKQSMYSQKFESEFFVIRIFKKGTVHLQFKDRDVLNRFNLMAAEGYGWLRSKSDKKRKNWKTKNEQK